MLTIAELQYLVTISRTGSMTIAAQLLYVTPSTISHAMTKLEKNLNVKLFERASNGIVLTENGRKLASLAEDIILANNELHLEAKKISKAKDTWKFTIYAQEGIAANILPAIIPELYKHNLDVLLFINTFSKMKRNVLIEPNSIGLGIIKENEFNQLKESKKFRVMIINKFKVCLVINKVSQWVKVYDNEVSVYDLIEIPIALNERYETLKEIVDFLLHLGKDNFKYYPSMNIVAELLRNNVSATLGIPCNDRKNKYIPIRESEYYYFCYFTSLEIEELLLQQITELTQKYLYSFIQA